VLKHVVGEITDVGFGVDHQPRFPFGRQHVAGVQVGAEKDVALRRSGQEPERGDVLGGQARGDVGTVAGRFQLELVSPAGRT
jgi:hypothetical protein